MEFASYDELARLVSRAQAGDSAAFDALHEKTAPILRFTIANKVGFAEAEDLLQEVYLVAWRNLDGIDPQSVVAYLNATARNVCSNYLRQRKRLSGMATDLAEDETLAADTLVASGAPGEAANPAETAVERDLHRRLRETMATELDDQERSALLMRYFLEMRNEDVAAQLGVSERTVKRIVARALATLRHKLGAMPVGVDIAAAVAAAQGAQASGLGEAIPSGATPMTSPTDTATGSSAGSPDSPAADSGTSSNRRENGALREHAHRFAAVAAVLAVAAIGVAAALTPPPTAALPDEPEPPATAAPAYAPPTCEETWTEDGLTWAHIRPGSSPVDRAWCAAADGTVCEPLQKEEGAGTVSYAFELPSGTYTLHVTDAAGKETTGPLKVTLYPEP